MLTIEVSGLDQIDANLTALGREQIPAGIMFGLAKVGRGVLTEEQRVMRGVFDRPTPFTLGAMKITHWPKKSELWIDVGLKESAVGMLDRSDVIIQHTLEPHIPGYQSGRNRKGSEKYLRLAGFMAPNQWLMPARNFKLNQYGNVPGPTMSKMLADMDVYALAQYRHPIRRTRAARRKYVWISMRSSRGRDFAGIFAPVGRGTNRRLGLQMVVVDKAPRYEKRFAFHAIAQRFVDRNIDAAIRSGIVRALMTMR